MCTVVCDWRANEPVRVLALRDELVGREFDDPDAWWPDQPHVVGGRDRVAGGTWAATDVARGRCALVLNRIERHEGSPSRGGLPLLAARYGATWTGHVEHTDMAAFTLVLADPAGLIAWTWDAVELRRHDLAPGRHMITTAGVDTSDPRTTRWAGELAPERWAGVLLACRPSAAPDALVVRRRVPVPSVDSADGSGADGSDADGARERRTAATVFAQIITAVPGRAEVRWSRTPWLAESWTEREWDAAAVDA